MEAIQKRVYINDKDDEVAAYKILEWKYEV